MVEALTGGTNNGDVAGDRDSFSKVILLRSVARQQLGFLRPDIAAACKEIGCAAAVAEIIGTVGGLR